MVEIGQGLADSGQGLLFLSGLPFRLSRRLPGPAQSVFGPGQVLFSRFGLPAQ